MLCEPVFILIIKIGKCKFGWCDCTRVGCGGSSSACHGQTIGYSNRAQ